MNEKFGTEGSNWADRIIEQICRDKYKNKEKFPRVKLNTSLGTIDLRVFRG